MRFGLATTPLLATVFDEVFGKLIINRGFACRKKRTRALSAREKCHDPLRVCGGAIFKKVDYFDFRGVESTVRLFFFTFCH